jgi:hypothetical protein
MEQSHGINKKARHQKDQQIERAAGIVADRLPQTFARMERRVASVVLAIWFDCWQKGWDMRNVDVPATVRDVCESDLLEFWHTVCQRLPAPDLAFMPEPSEAIAGMTALMIAHVYQSLRGEPSPWQGILPTPGPGDQI